MAKSKAGPSSDEITPSSDAGVQENTASIAGMLPREGRLPTDPAQYEQALVQAISRYLVATAEQTERYLEDYSSLPGIRLFQSAVLRGNLLAPDAVDHWVAERQKEEGEKPPSQWLAGVPLQPEDINQWEPEIGEDGYPTGRAIIHELRIPMPTHGQFGANTPTERPNLSHRYVEYLVPHSPVPTKQPVRADSNLDTLRRLSLLLSRDYLWRPSQATMLVLTGQIPYSEAAEAALREGLSIRGRRARELSVKILELAVFTAWHDEEPLAVRMTQWNHTFPEWGYTQLTNFGWESKEAVRKLTERIVLRRVE